MTVIQLTPLSKPVKTAISIPCSKSYTNRALFIASLCQTPVKILNPLISDDTKAMIDCLKTLGVKILARKNYIEVNSSLLNISNRLYKLDANLSGLTIRFLLALSTLIPGTKIVYGQEGLNKRPVKELVSALISLGAKIEYLKKTGFPPVKVISSKLTSNKVKINGLISSQYFSALLMIAPLIGGITIEVIGKQTSKPFIDMTIDIMNHFGVKVLSKNYKKYQVLSNQKYHGKEYSVEGDISSASYFGALAALTKSKITLKNINPNSKQADMRFLQILKTMGNKIIYGKNEITMMGNGVKAVNVNMNDCPDQVQTLAVLTSFAKGVTKITGISNLRIKETDRIFAIKEELKKMGIKTKSTKNSLIIYGGNPKAAKIETYGDHRMAMAFAIAGTKLSGMKIINPDVVNKTFPKFWEKLSSIGIKNQIINKNIVLIGMRGSGKTTIAKLLAKKSGKQYIELDEILAKKVGMDIPQIVKKYGWDFFRNKEAEIAKEAALHTDKIISTGGGIILNAKNVEVLKENGIFILLNASPSTLLKRIGNDSNRPFLTNAKTRKEDIENLLKERLALYKQAADYIIETDGLKPAQVFSQIIKRIKA